jgi:hypothetical protein
MPVGWWSLAVWCAIVFALVSDAGANFATMSLSWRPTPFANVDAGCVNCSSCAIDFSAHMVRTVRNENHAGAHCTAVRQLLCGFVAVDAGFIL